MPSLNDLLSPYEWSRIYHSIDRKVQFGGAKQHQFLKGLYELIASNVPLLEACKHLNHYGDASQKKITQAMLAKLQRGLPIAEAMSEWFPSAVARALHAGEQSGTFKESLFAVCSSYERQRKGLLPLFLKLLYPIGIFLGTLSGTVGIDNMVLSQLERFPSYQPEASHVYVGWLSDFARSAWMVSPLLLLVPPIIIYVLRSSFDWRIRIQNYPIVKLYSYFTAIEFLRGYSILSLANVAEKRAFEQLQTGASNFYKWHLNNMLRNLKMGAGEAESIDTGLVPNEAIAYLKIVAKTQGYHRALKESEESLYEVVHRQINRSSQLISSVLIIFSVSVILSVVSVIYYQPPVN